MNCNVETMAEPARIYISYSGDDLPFVRAVADELRTHGVDAWFDESHIASGDHWQHAQADALRSANVVAIFIGKKTQTPWMNFEIGAAVGGEKRVVPIYLESTQEGLPPLLAQFMAIDAHALKPAQVADQIAEVAGHAT